MAYKARKRKVKKNIPEGQAHIHSTFNNTIVTITDKDGNAVSWASSGTSGFKGSKKKTPFAAGMSAEAAGIAVCLIAYSHHACRTECDAMTAHYYRLREYAMQHPEAHAILRIID